MTAKDGRSRLDVILVQRGLVPSRQKARALIMAGQVLVDEERVDKPGREFPQGVKVLVKEGLAYVSRGGLKLEAALDGLAIDVEGLKVLDAGASTGGFTDCLIQRGAAKVIAADVGYGQLDWRLRNDPRVSVIERTNVRHLTPDMLPHHVDAAVADLSFISLKLVLGVFAVIVPPGGWVLPLVKPQFEVGRDEVGKGGVVRDPEKIQKAVDAVKSFAQESGFSFAGRLDSPVHGPKGNREVFLHLIREKG